MPPALSSLAKCFAPGCTRPAVHGFCATHARAPAYQLAAWHSLARRRRIFGDAQPAPTGKGRPRPTRGLWWGPLPAALTVQTPFALVIGLDAAPRLHASFPGRTAVAAQPNLIWEIAEPHLRQKQKVLLGAADAALAKNTIDAVQAYVRSLTSRRLG